MARHYKAYLKKYARALRKKMTDSEMLLWSRIRKKQLLGAQFYRQSPIEGFIVDYLCPSAKLIIEVDGGQHNLPEQIERDRKRDGALHDLGYKVLRFSDRDVLLNIQGVVEALCREMETRLTNSPLTSS